MDTFIHYGMAAGIQAIEDSGLVVTEDNADRIGVDLGSGIGGLPMIERTHAELGKTRSAPNQSVFRAVFDYQHDFGFPFDPLRTQGTQSVDRHGMFDTGLHSIGFAARIIAYGDADVMVAGGAESTVSPLGIGGFASARALSSRNDDPATASRPWDKDRDGFVLGEGAGVLVLEEDEHAKARGAKIYAEIVGFGMSADANHMTAPLEDGSGASKCMSAAINDAQINPDQIDYINAHGTSTPLGDKAETVAVKRSLGAHAKNIVMSSSKSMVGHLLGGAGGLESVITALAIYNQVAPPTINIFNQDPECDLDYCANTARDMRINYALKNSFGFGGTNGSLIFGKI